MKNSFPKDPRFVQGRIKSVQYAVQGAWHLLRTEHSVMAQTALGVLFCGLGYALHITLNQWLAQIIVFGMVLAVESLNTALEKMADFVHPDFHPAIGTIKDMAAGAVFFAAMAALAVLGLIYIPYLL